MSGLRAGEIDSGASGQVTVSFRICLRYVNVWSPHVIRRRSGTSHLIEAYLPPLHGAARVTSKSDRRLNDERPAEEFRTCGPAEYNLQLSRLWGQTRQLTTFNTHGRKPFLNRLQEPGEDETRRRLSDSVASMSEVTRILSAIEQGDPQAAEQLLPLVYDELRGCAKADRGEAGANAASDGAGPRSICASGGCGQG